MKSVDYSIVFRSAFAASKIFFYQSQSCFQKTIHKHISACLICVAYDNYFNIIIINKTDNNNHV